jgi:hypothetical protein
MFKRILVVGMMLLSGVASAQQAKGQTTLDVTLYCYTNKQVVDAIVKMNYKPLLTAKEADVHGTYSAWLGPEGQFLVLATKNGRSCIVLDAVDVEVHVEDRETL